MVHFASPQPMRPARLIREAYAVPAEAVLRQLQVDFASGVTEDEAVLRLAQYGPNALATRPQVSALRILINQVKGPVVLLLGGAAALAGAFGDWTEAVAILLVLGINTLIGFVTELRAVRSMEALR